ncbi:tandem-95 repeat protein [Aquirufa lenticrescens]
MKLRLPNRFVLIVLFQLVSVFAFAQTVGGTTAGDDFDGDGIINSVDIDDDNDGVLDTDEWICAPSLMSKTGISVSSTVAWGYNSTTLANLVDNTEQLVAYSNSEFLNQTILQFDLPSAKILSAIEIGTGGGGTRLPLGTTGTYKVQGWNGSAWVDLTLNQTFGTPNTPISATNNSYKISIASNFTAYSKYRIYGTSNKGTVSDWIQEAYFTERICVSSTDTDSDTNPNSFDLDSDNDGCADAIESSSSTTFTSISTCPTGADSNSNGLLDVYESATAGVISYTSTYSNYALLNAINGCIDSDLDGVRDVFDLDDDNDGILDSVECTPDQLNTNESNGTFGTAAAPRNTSNTNVTGGYIYSGSNTGASQYAVINQSTPYHPSASFWRYVGHTTGTATDAYLAVNGNTTIGNFYSESVSLKTGAKYRISFWHQAASAANDYQLAAEILSSGNAVLATANTGAQNSLGWKLTAIDYTSPSNQTVTFIIKNVSTNASGNDFSIDDISITQISCPDDDEDGIPNSLDLDSDGDGCPDAKEAGLTLSLISGSVVNKVGNTTTTTTVASAVFSGTFGLNGFANALETAPESGAYSGIYTYALAIDATINGCADADTDGIQDLVDIDDDNDGVLDTTEQYCTTIGALTDLYGPTYWKSISWTGGAFLAQYNTSTPNIYIDGILNNGVEVFRPGTEANPIAGDDFTATPIIFTLVPKNPMHADGFSIVNDYGEAGDHIVKADIKLYTGSVMNPILMGTETIDNMTRGSARYPFSKGYNNITTVKILVYKTQPAGTQAANGMQMGELGLYSNAGNYCGDLDTDNDGVVNRLDRDSDGDGCSDALETGTTTSTTANYAFTGNMGSNGLDNSLETVTDNGVINYASTYSFATSKNYAICLDFDQDGVNDVVDIDDDNDGILDAIESPNCYYTRSEWLAGNRPGFTVSTTLAMNASYRSPSELVDGDNGTAAANYAVNFNASTTAAQTVYAFKMPVPVELKTIYLGYVNASTHFNANTVLRLEGSNNNTSWTTLGNAYGAVTTVPGVTGTINANSFAVTQNSGKYLYYRIYWVSGGGVNAAAYSNEVYFETYSNYQASQYPELDCTSDTDDDGISNHQDLDSDGDGCPDAREAGVLGTLTTGTITNKVNGSLINTTNITGAVASSTYSTNGFADALETSSESGIYSGTYNYNYARSSAVVFCLDSDNDGVVDISDLDDDNDGVLDSEECPPFNINNLSYAPADYTVTNGASASQTFPAAPDGLVVNVFTLDNSFNVRINGTHLTNPQELQFWTGGPTDALFEFLDGTTYSAVWGMTGNKFKPLIRIYIDKVGRVKVYGSRTSYGALEEMRLRNGSFNNITLNTNATNTFQIGQEVVAQTFISGDYGVIVPPNCDDDNDGIPNGLDLDSDGDGCPDAKEAGVSGNLLSGDVKNGTNGAVTSTTNLPNAIAGSAGNYGANGLANSVETSSESGVVSYTSTYTNFARSSTLNICVDSDGDGVADVLDIDDDNDGVLDTVEKKGCSDTGLNLSALTFSGSAVTGKTANTLTSSNTNAWISSYSTENFALPLSFKFKRPTVVNTAMFGLLPVYGTQNATNWSDDAYKFYFTSNTVSFPYGTTFNVSQTAKAEDEYSVDISATGFVTMKINGIQKVAYQGVNSPYKLAVSGVTTTVFTDILLTNPSNPIVTTCTDMDNDGRANYLDLDSDGDGCSDMIESGSSTNTSTSTYPTGTDTNANGLLNSYENNTAGAINYVSTYVDYALSNSINACLDSDGDLVSDVTDLDDDNDGVLDATEMTCTASLLSYDGVTISKPNSINYTYSNGSTLNNLIDGVDANIYIARNPSGTLNGEWFRIALPTLKVLNYVEIGHYNGQTLFAVGSTYKVEGSLDGVNWTNVSGTLTYNNQNKSVNGRYSTYNSNAASFNNSKPYFYYRLVGINATDGGTWATELYFNQRNCVDVDTDDDGIPNRLELDSDGDGCSDAKEAGATSSTTANYAFTGNFGGNGFADGLETATESGNYSGTYTYSYVANPLINACADNDGDGVLDYFDIDDDNDGALDATETVCSIYSYTGSNTTITIPAGATKIDVKMWGAGGGGSNTSNSTAGSGAYVYGKLSVTPNETLTLIVGQGGINKSTAATFGGGGAGGNDPFASLFGGSGGGRSELRRGTTSLLIAGGGGGAAGSPTNTTYAGGAGIRLGQDGIPNAQVSTGAGKGGTQSAGGLGGTITGITGFNGTNGAQYVGGNGGAAKQANAGAGGGGGGGWYGGGGGAGNGFGDYQESAAGGGSSYFNVALLQKVGIPGNTNSVGGSTTLAPNNTDPAYVAGVGTGGAANSAGGNGLVQICYIYDTDGDGVANQFDLDSDADGCSDAFEAGSVSAPTSTSTIPTGTDTNGNGLLNSYEGANVGTINYKSRYATFAINSQSSACLDSDTDGIPDVNDIDDDNDGVLDTSEQTNCITSGIDLTSFTYNGTSITGKTANSFTTAGGDVWKSSYSDQNLQLPISLKFNRATATGIAMFGLLPAAASQTVGNYNDNGYKQYPYLGDAYGYFQFPNGTWDYGPIAISATDELSITISSTGYVTAAINGVTKKAFQGTVSDYKLALSSYRASSLTGIILSDATRPAIYTCTDLDSDTDGIPNRLDLDSDGDNCPDAKEAGVRGTLTSGSIVNKVGNSNTTTPNVSNAIAAGTYSANGFADAIETATESGLYSGTYAYGYAIDAGVSTCLDTDSDGIVDINDIDDDNDGVLDLVECPMTNVITNGGFDGGKTGWTSSANWVWSSGYVWNSADNASNNALSQTFAKPIFDPETLLQDVSFDFNTNGTGWAITSSGTATMDVSINNVLYATITNPSGGTTASIVAKNGAILNRSSANIVTTNIPSTKIIISLPKSIFTNSNTINFNFSASTDDIGIDNVFVGSRIATCDTDSDGKLNSKDLDSDGDGCADAIEASSSTTATSTSAHPTGTDTNSNGLLDVYESTTAGVISYTSTYKDYALNNTLNACLDSDSDGVKDVADLDDDNDGVLDLLEDKTCASLNINGSIAWKYWNVPKTHTWHDLLPMSGTGGSTAPNLFTILDEYGMPDMAPTPTSTGTITTWTKPASTDNSNIDVLRFQGYLHFPKATQGKTVSVRVVPDGNAAKVGAWVISTDENPKNWIDPTSSTGVPLLDMKNTLGYTNPGTGWTGVPVGFIDAITTYVNNAAIPTVRIASSNFTAKVIGAPNGHYVSFWIADPINAWDMFKFQYSTDNTNWVDLSMASFATTAPSNCTALDTDRDGIPNRLDLDSDGDGCSDASEAKTVSSLTATTVSGNFGNNGFANSIETATESGLFSGTYFYERAIDPTIKACTDTDFDGVSDLDDLDDDNDGILDTIECVNSGIFLENFETSTVNPYRSAAVYQPGVSLNGQLATGGANGTTKALFHNTGTGTYVVGDIFWGTRTPITVKPNSTYEISYYMKDKNGVSLPSVETWVNNVKIGNATTITTSWVKYTITWNSGLNTTLDLSLKNLNISGVGNDFYIDEIAVVAICVDGDADNDGIPNRIDLDSDGDGCSDANEAYNSSLTQGTDGNQQFGTNPITVDATGKITSATYTGTNSNYLSAGSASVITTQPADRSTTPGGTVVFSANVTAGTGTTTYQWQVSTNGGNTWSNMTNSSTYAGAGTSTLTVSNVSIAMKGYRYQLLLSQSNYVCGNVTSSAAKILMDNTPSIVDDAKTGTEDTPLTGNVLTNDSGSGSPAAALTVTTFTVGGVTYNAGQTATIANVGTFVMNADGSFTFTPVANYNGSVPAIEYTATDANGGSDVGALALTITPVNDAPVAVDDVISTNENTPVSGNVLTDGTDDSDADGNTITITQFTINGVTYNPGDVANIPGKGSITMNANGSYTFTPTTGYTGAVPDLDYMLSDGNGGSDVGRLTITVNPVNDAPLATDDIVTILQGSTATGNLLTNDADVDAGATLTVTSFSFTINGTTYTNTTGSSLVTMPGIGTIQISANGLYSFVPTGTYTGTVPHINYTLSDGSLTDTGLLDIFVAPVNASPIANDDTNSTMEDTAVSGNVLTDGTDDSDAEGNALVVTQYSFTIISGNSSTTYTYPAGSTNVIPGAGTIVMNANGTYTFTPFPNYNGAVPTITYTISDGNGGTDTGTLNINVTAMNDRPIAVNDDNKTTPEDTPVTVNVLANDSDIDGGNTVLTVTQFTIAGINGSFTTSSIATIPNVGTVTVTPTGDLTFTPVINYNGPVPTITYTVTDGVATNTANVNIAVTPVNDLPVVSNESLTTPENTAITGFSLLTNDTDIESNTLSITQITVSGVTYPAGSIVELTGVGTIIVNADGAYTFTPNRGYFGTLPAITYAVSDGNGGVTSGTLSITVTPVNDPPVVVNETVNMLEDAVATGNLLTNDSDPEQANNALSITQFTIAGISGTFTSTATIPGVGTITINANGTYTFTPTANYNGIVPIIEYTVSDGQGASTNGNLTIVVAAVNDAPIVTNENFSEPINTPISNNVLANDRDVEASALSVTNYSIGGLSYPAGQLTTIQNVGTIILNADGSFVFTPAANYFGSPPAISYTVSDGTATSTGTLSLTITPIDADGDGIPDATEKGSGSTPVDTDSDGTPDWLDTDSDNDGIPDSLEDSVCVGTLPCTPTDTDGDGTPDYRDLDSDGDGITDALEDSGCTGTAPCTPTDSDGDGTPNYLDLDSDGDGITDAIEKGPTSTPRDTDNDGTPDFLDTDSDGDGISDRTEGTVDTDGDGIPNYLDPDSDGDGITDAIEGTTDTDGDGTPNYLDLDSDGDGITDAIEKGPNATPVDTDGDGTPDYKDLDSDNDGIPDSVEGSSDADADGIPNFRDLDSDGDGISDRAEGTADTDGDGSANYLDEDSDGDGIPDRVEGIVDTDGDGIPNYKDTDSDGDGILDSMEDAGCTGTAPCTPTDTDGDGTPNYLDLDSDGDGISDNIEKGPTGTPVDTDSDGFPDYLDLDSDGDGITDAVEKGSGTTPLDTDGDGTPDFRDLDSDGDGITDANEGTTDTDGDGIPNYRDLDSDGDGKSDATEGNVDTDLDGTPNYLDLDSDGDGVLDAVDQCPLVAGLANLNGCPLDSDGDGLVDTVDTDDDNDGILDTVEAAACSPSAVDCDTDGDGIPNRLDLDSDGDGIKDITEANGTDANNDGIADGTPDSNGVPASANGGLTPPNTDGTGNSNPYDLDSDGDGISDAIEKGSGSTLADIDNDNTPDYLDPDSDGDGITDAVEGSIDTDGDGIPNFRDLDSDGDGITDAVEGTVDTDGDGIPNYKDLDSDGDGITDAIEDADCTGVTPCSPTNSDNDNIPDYLDSDSDNDGIPDAIEKGPTGTPVDTDNDGTPDYLDTDSDGDGILDSVEDAGCTGTVPCTPTDTDGDGVPNFRDLDSDGDGITDAIEGTTDTDNDGRPNYLDVDSDGDGISDALEGNIDSDNDGIPNYLDLDSDADGIPDAIEKGPTSTPVDSDNDGTPDYLDLDTDGDGIPDSVEDAACSGTTCTPTDSDNDGIPNHRDLDSDGDGIPDSVEKGLDGNNPDNTDGALGPDYLDTDSDNDGILDAVERGIDGNNPLDTDGDGIPDYKEVDSDGDGIPDAVEGTVDTDGDGIPDYRDLDSDNDGILDATEDAGCTGTAPCTPTDTDNDGIPNYKDLDSDADNKPDQSEGETDYDGDNIPNYLDPDSDGDGINDISDQCPLLAGVLANNGCPDDTDADGIYDINDLDDDNDGILDTAEAAACSPASATCDTDGDGIPNRLDPDSDNDGISDVRESNGTDVDGDGKVDGAVDADGVPSSTGGGLTPPNTDGTTLPDPYDTDSDGDGISDALEKGPNGNTPVDTDGDGIPDYRDTDSDNDGIPDSVERGTGAAILDTDGNGIPDFRDTDSDNDGITDAVEKGPSGATPLDTDLDGIPNYRDLDSDGDGMTDATEGTVDTDGDGKPNYIDVDSDGDGILDSIEKGFNPASPVDTDGDGIPNYKDLDSDGDGIPDAIEGTTDTDGDGIPNYLDTDSDGDGILDSIEDDGCTGTAPCTPTDTDGDGIPNYLDLDTDGDGKTDAVEKGPSATPMDSDGDGVPDYRDVDNLGKPDVNVTNKSVPVSGNVKTNDPVPAGTTYGQPAQLAGATLTMNADGTYTFTSAVPGKYVYYVSVCGPNQTSGCPQTPLEITVLDPLVADAPVANNDHVTMEQGTVKTVNVLANDKAGEVNNALVPSSLSITTAPTHGTTLINSDGTIRYTPSPYFVGTDSLVYRICDNQNPALCKPAVLYFTVEAAGAPAVTTAADDYNNVVAGSPATGTLLANDSNTTGAALTASLVTGPTSAQGTFTMAANGTYTFTPTAGFSGPVDIVYQACTTGNICSKATLHILVDPAPVLVDDTASGFANVPVNGNVSINDVVRVGTTYGQPAALTGATIVVGPSGTYTFTATVAGTYTYTIPVCAPGQTVNCPTETLVITVTAPAPADDAVSAFANVPKSGNVSTNDVIPTGSTYGQPAAITGATITVAANGTYTFTATVAGTYTYTIPVCAPGQTVNCPTETVVITVNEPGPVNDTETAFANVAKTGNVSTNDLNPAGTTFGQPAAITGATITVNADGTYSFTATAAGTYTYTIPVCAPSQTVNCPTETLVITVTAPGPVDDTATAFANVPKSGNIATNDSNPAGTTFGQPAAITGATITVAANGTYTFTATAAGTYTYTIPVCAPGQTVNCPTETLVITVTAPGPVDDTATAFANVPKSGNVSTNDVIPTGSTYGQPAAITGATITVAANGTYTFTATVAGTYTYTIPVCAPGQTVNCPTETLVITVTAPGPVDDTATAFANVPKSGNVATNDSNPAGTTFGQPAAITGATITVNADGTYNFTATAAGTYTYTIPVCAPGQTSNCPTETLVITVTAPGPVDDVATSFANVPKTGNVATNDSNPAGTTFGQPAAITGATITVNADGTYTFTATIAGTYTYTIPVCAPGQTSNCPTETLVITVTAPGPVDDTATAFANVPKTGNVATNDSNPAGTTFGQPAAITGATITVNADGTYSFTATAAGTYTYTIPVCAPGQTSNCPTETLVITVTSPQVTNDTASTTINTAITGNVATNDNNPAGTTFGQPAAITGATIAVAANGTYTFTATAAGTYTYTIPVCAPGQTSNCPTETLVITVTDPTIPYTAPTTNPDIDATNINVPVSGNVSTNDVSGATYGQPAQQSGATITVNANGTYSFTATIPGVYTYLVPACPTGQTTNCPTVPLVITVSDPLKDSNSPVANGDVATVNAGSSVTSKVLANDKAANPAASLNPASLAIVTNGANGTAVVNSDGTITYTPKAGFTGVDEITYRICDNSTPALCSTAKVAYTIQPVAEPSKTFATDDYNSSPAGTPVTGSVLANDKNTAGETLTATIVSGVSAVEGTLVFNADGTYVFTPAPGFSGPVDVVYTVCSASNVCAKATLHLVVNPAPVITPDFNATLIGIPVNGSAATNDVVPAGSTYSQPASISGASLKMNPDGTYIFSSTTPGTYEYLVPVCAKAQTTNCPLVPLVITVSDPNAITNPPIANADVVSVAAGSPVTTNVLANDQAANVGGVLVYSTLAITNAPLNGTAKVNADGTITYTPAPGFVGTDVLTYTICDNSQPALCKTAKVYYTVGATASKNLLASDDFATTQGGLVSGNVLGNDKSSTGSALTATAVTNVDPAKGSFSLSPSGAYTFTPAAGYVGPVDIIYSVCSADGKCTQATLHITVLPVPDMIAPQAITPNGDGKNDTLIFRGLPGLNIENRLTIYNRWGNIVFSTGNYQNNWSGQTDNAFGALATDSQLPDGTYYYILDFFGARPNLGNYVYLDRSSN